MKLGVLTTSYPHVRAPSAGVFVRELNRALATRGHSIEVVCAEHPGDTAIEDAHVRVHSVEYAWPIPSRHAQTFYGEGAPDRLRRGGVLTLWGALATPLTLGATALRVLRGCDGWISHFAIPCGWVAGTLRGNRPHVAFVHGTDGQWLQRMPAWMQSRWMRGCTGLRATHQKHVRDLCAEARDEAQSKVWIAPMGYSPMDSHMAKQSRVRVRETWGLHNDDVVVLTVARFVDVKGMLHAVRAAGAMKHRVLWVMAGDGPERERVAREARELGVRVQMEGAVSPMRRDELMAAADVFVSSSQVTADGRTDNAPTTLVEAMGAGLGVVATRVGGCEEMLGDAGVLVDARDVKGLADAVDALVASRETRLRWGARAAQRARAWTWSEQAKRVEEMLQSHRL